MRRARWDRSRYQQHTNPGMPPSSGVAPILGLPSPLYWRPEMSALVVACAGHAAFAQGFCGKVVDRLFIGTGLDNWPKTGGSGSGEGEMRVTVSRDSEAADQTGQTSEQNALAAMVV